MGACSATGMLLNGADLLDSLHDDLTCEFDVSQFDKTDELVEELFSLHDISHDGTLSEDGLIRLNEKIAMLHCGGDVDQGAVTAKYRKIFRRHLDPDGKPVAFPMFHSYMLAQLGQLDKDSVAHEMIMESLISEARLGRAML
mmetsp:Transcript_64969/g.171913  ORF Transcript_64969/g.171913 Transcript_64969/m.171913 type:complete len:142 (-) Transcript_64969:643-1068(-)